MVETVVQFQPFGIKTPVRAGTTLLDAATKAGVSIEAICGGSGKCGKCRVTVTAGATSLSPIDKDEMALLSDREVKAGTRLACRAKVAKAGRVVVEVPEGSRREHHRLLAKGVEPPIKLAPGVSKIRVTLPPASMKDFRADDDRLVDELRKRARKTAALHPGVHTHLPRALRDKGWVTTVSLFRGCEIVKAEPGDTTDVLNGVAVDIGTTKVVAYLVDLNNGEVVGTQSTPNPQIPFGEDLMSRISFTMRQENGLEQLRKVIVDGLNTLIERLCVKGGVDPDDVMEVMVVGNTAMHHIFFGIPPQSLASAPYAPVVRTSLAIPASQGGLDVYPFGKVSALPNVAGFVGADAVADLLSSGLYDDRKVGMMIDIGTNTEIVAGNRDRLISCSCASGPAFEGAHIRFGMRASTGAIERVWIDRKTKEVMYTTVEDRPARGICGSGIVDAVSEMLNAGILDASGKIAVGGGAPGVRRGEGGVPEFVLVDARETETGEEIVVTQHDIQEIQLAKAAIFTGVATLMRKLKVRPSDIDRVYAAGAFGTYVDAESAINIGMYPDVPADRISFIGNAAGSGARMALKSVKARDLAERLSREVKYVELASEKDFQQEFAKAMFLPHRDLTYFPNRGKRSRGKAPPKG